MKTIPAILTRMLHERIYLPQRNAENAIDASRQLFL